jgi:hypothetical protein
MMDDADASGCRIPIGVVLAIMLVLALMGGLFYDFLSGQFGLIPRSPTGPDGPGEQNRPALNAPIPAISDRYFASGSVHALVHGYFEFDISPSLDEDNSYVKDGFAWIGYGKTSPTVLVSLNEPENSVAVSDGHRTALGVDSQCVFNVRVTDGEISGSVKCEHAQALLDGEVVGTESIVIDRFSATTAH